MSLAFHHVINSSSDTSDSAKLVDLAGPTDIPNSTATGAHRAVSGEMDMPASAATLDTHVLNTPIYASRIVATLVIEAAEEEAGQLAYAFWW